MDAFCEGIRMTSPELLSKKERLQACYDYVDTVNSNIESFMFDKTKTMVINLENIQEDFKEFWNNIGAKGDLEEALSELNIQHNPSSKRKIQFFSRIRKLVIREYRNIVMSIKS